MNKIILNIFFHALAALLCLSSCALEEPIDTPQNSDGYIEFVARAVGYNNQMVETKSAADNFEKAVYNCFFLLFDNETGDRLNTPVNLVGDNAITLPTQLVRLDKVNATSVTACFIANVPVDFVSNIIGLNRPSGVENNETNNNKYLNTAVLSGITYGTEDNFGKPFIDLDGATGTAASVACVPMFEKVEVTLPSSSQKIQIPLKRLFAKVTANLKVALTDLSDFEATIQTGTHYKLTDVNLYNLPSKVKLVEDSSSESEWRTSAGLYSSTPLRNSNINTQIYNNSEEGYSCSFYVPEFYLNPISNPTQQQEFKPKNFPNGENQTPRTYPVYMQLEGSFVKYSISSSTITYQIYLGGDPVDDFSLARNTHYINDLTIQNTNKNNQDQNNLDHRVSTNVINNPVAKAQKTANCYVISQPGEYRFPAYMGAYNHLHDAVPCEGGVDVEILVNKAQFDGSSVSAINISNEAYDPVTNMISFSVASAPVINVVPNGNVVIALLDRPRTNPDRQVIWSWHLWFSTDFSGGNESEWATIRTQKYPNAKEFMDRNLGANIATSSAVEGLGLYYRFNNKNPFIESAYIGGGVNGTATFNPANDSNQDDDTKAVHDPCPPGYRVPKFDEWPSATPKHVNLDVTGLFGSSGVMLFYDQANLANDVYYPYSGYRSGTQVQYKTQDDREYTTPSTYTVTESDDDVEIKSGTKWNDKEQTGIRTTTTTTYYNYVYTVPIASTSGYLLGQDKALYYENTEDKIDIAYTNMHVLRCNAIDHVKVENVKRSRRSITTAWGLIPWESVSTISEEDGEEYTVTNHRSFTLNQPAINNTENKTRLVSTYATPDSSHGYQIRCIKE